MPNNLYKNHIYENKQVLKHSSWQQMQTFITQHFLTRLGPVKQQTSHFKDRNRRENTNTLKVNLHLILVSCYYNVVMVQSSSTQRGPKKLGWDYE